MEAVRDFEAHEPCFTPSHCNANAQRFSRAEFRERMRDVVDRAMFEHASVVRPLTAAPRVADAVVAA
jgi:hypothetical protein